MENNPQNPPKKFRRIKFRCPECRWVLKVPDYEHKSWKRYYCKNCENQILYFAWMFNEEYMENLRRKRKVSKKELIEQILFPN